MTFCFDALRSVSAYGGAVTTTIPYGSWPSPLTAAAVSAASPRLEGARFVGDEVWWGESVPEQGGRTTVRRRDGIRATELGRTVLPAPWNARSRVHEYGGGSWTTTDDGDLVFVEKEDQRIWILADGDGPRPLTPPDSGMRFGGLTLAGRAAARHPRDARRVPPPRRDIVEVPLDRRGVWDPSALAVADRRTATSSRSRRCRPTGRTSPGSPGTTPNMPWDTTELRVGRLEDGIVAEWTTVAGGERHRAAPAGVDRRGRPRLHATTRPAAGTCGGCV